MKREFVIKLDHFSHKLLLSTYSFLLQTQQVTTAFYVITLH